MAKKIYKKFTEIETELKRLGCKHVKLQNLEHQDIVPFNPAKKPIAPKILEIKKKLSVLPEGVYCIVCQDRFGKNVHATNFYFGKGSYDGNLSEEIETHKTRSSESENVLSYDQALKMATENAELKADVKRLEAEVLSLNSDIAELETENTALAMANEALALEEPTPVNPFAGLAEFAKELSPMFPGIADNWFALKNKEAEYKQAKLLMENGYEIPGLTKSNNGASTSKNGSAKALDRVARPGTKQWPEYVNAVLNLSEANFDKHLKLVEKQYPDIYSKLCDEVYTEEEEDEEESEEQ